MKQFDSKNLFVLWDDIIHKSGAFLFQGSVGK